jgi:hypothetical protein
MVLSVYCVDIRRRFHQQQTGASCDGVHHVVMVAGRMVDRVLATARRAPLQSGELGNQFRMVEQIDAAAVNESRGAPPIIDSLAAAIPINLYSGL